MRQNAVPPIRIEFTSPAVALKILRIFWLFGVAGVLSVPIIVLLMRHHGPKLEVGLDPWMGPVSWAVLGLGVPVAYFVRNQVYKRQWRDAAVTPTGYFKANLFFFGILEFPLGFALMAMFCSGHRWPTGLTPFLIVVLLVLVNYPTGQPMRPTAPRLGVPERRGD